MKIPNNFYVWTSEYNRYSKTIKSEKLLSNIRARVTKLISENTSLDVDLSFGYHKDVRYKEQKMRITSCQSEDNANGVKCQSFYLIEGNVNTIKFRKSQDNSLFIKYQKYITQKIHENNILNQKI